MVDATRMSTSLLIYSEQRTKELSKVSIMEHQYFNSKWSIIGYIFIYRETRCEGPFLDSVQAQAEARTLGFVVVV